MTPSVDVAIVAYRHWDLTRSCLEHLARQTVAHRVTLCDNGCDEGTAELVAAEFPDVEVVRLERNMPYAVACNRAVANGSADLVVMMNNDVDVRPDFIERVVAPFAADSGLGSVGTLLLRPGEQRIDSAGMVVDTTLSGFTRLRGRPSAEAGAARPGVTGPYGAAAAFRRAAWEQVGGLDETIPAYCEDLDLALRLRQAGWPAALALDAVGRPHRWGDVRTPLGRSAPAGRLRPRLCAAPLRGAANAGPPRERSSPRRSWSPATWSSPMTWPLCGDGWRAGAGRRACPRERHRRRPRWTRSSDSSSRCGCAAARTDSDLTHPVAAGSRRGMPELFPHAIRASFRRERPCASS